ncbi:transposable element Tcb2 transposase [Trichonephila clavipes]|nr:transposable element Tcb2 transposase [Trichonephila clavipes]
MTDSSLRSGKEYSKDTCFDTSDIKKASRFTPSLKETNSLNRCGTLERLKVKVQSLPSRKDPFHDESDPVKNFEQNASEERRKLIYDCSLFGSSPFVNTSSKPMAFSKGQERSASEERRQQDNLKLRCHPVEDFYGQKSSNCCQARGRICEKGLFRAEDGCESQHNCNPDATQQCNDPNCRFTHSLLDDGYSMANPLCSHGDFCDSDNAKCSHINTCCCQRNCSHSFHKHHNMNLEKCLKPEKLDCSGLEQRTPPLNATRLKPKRHQIRNTAVVSISQDKQVIVELLKSKNKELCVSDVCVISTDGMEEPFIPYLAKSLLKENDESGVFMLSWTAWLWDEQQWAKMFSGKWSPAKRVFLLVVVKRGEKLKRSEQATGRFAKRSFALAALTAAAV